ncbi:hypothetical protein [Pandoraea sp. CB10b_02]|uniref:hypothetical protein n=1 Tax=Pandoraea sp. CB10b_02 TaxID=2014535 RepID=UPI00257A8570|nr:hypothetical protein [Pandoraea sp. CB10b_02]
MAELANIRNGGALLEAKAVPQARQKFPWRKLLVLFRNRRIVVVCGGLLCGWLPRRGVTVGTARQASTA